MTEPDERAALAPCPYSDGNACEKYRLQGRRCQECPMLAERHPSPPPAPAEREALIQRLLAWSKHWRGLDIADVQADLAAAAAALRAIPASGVERDACDFWDAEDTEAGYSSVLEVVERYAAREIVRIQRRSWMPDVWAFHVETDDGGYDVREFASAEEAEQALAARRTREPRKA